MKWTKKQIQEWYFCNEHEPTKIEKMADKIFYKLNVEKELNKFKVDTTLHNQLNSIKDEYEYGASTAFYFRGIEYKYIAEVLEDAIKHHKTYDDYEAQLEHYRNVFKYIFCEVKTFNGKKFIREPFSYDEKMNALYDYRFESDHGYAPHEQNKDMLIAALYNKKVFNTIVTNFKSVFSFKPEGMEVNEMVKKI